MRWMIKLKLSTAFGGAARPTFVGLAIVACFIAGCGGSKEPPAACRALTSCCSALPAELKAIRAVDRECFQPPSSEAGCLDAWTAVQRGIGSTEGLAILHSRPNVLPPACKRDQL
jgi:hypothetical protein